MGKFRELKKNAEGSGQDEALVDNYRPVQQLNDRTVHVTYDVTSAAPTVNRGHLLVAAAGCLATLAWARY